MSEGDGTTFLQWKERAQSETREDAPRFRMILMIGVIVVVAAIVLGSLVLLLS
ncbi:hypothetical protein [Bounagaea algeriensis]